MKKRTQLFFLASVLMVVVGAILVEHYTPSFGQNPPAGGTRKPACGCFFCGNMKLPVREYFFNFEEPSRDCAGILAEDACPAEMAKLPEATRTAFCQRIKSYLLFTSFKESCPLLASACEPDDKDPSPKPKCEKPTPWLGTPPSGCKDVQSPQVTVNQATVTVSLCGYALWSVNHVIGATDKPDIEAAKESVAAFKERVRSQIGSRICCDSFREAVRTGQPCDPRVDLDCDGKPNREDTAGGQRYVSPRDNQSYSYSGSLPDINMFSKPEGAPIDPFPPGLNPDDPNFIPPADKCDCKWELVKGTLTCSTDGKQPHVYQARWRCPSTGNERFTRKEAPPGAPCK
jgi:hypothetical protein